MDELINGYNNNHDYYTHIGTNYFEFNYASHPCDEFLMETYDDDHDCDDNDCHDNDGGIEQNQNQNQNQQQQQQQDEHKEIMNNYRNNLIIWDWDDTIFPTYSFRTQQDKKDKNFMSKLNILVNYIEKIFDEMIKIYGSSNIMIVTNASETWINKCLNVEIVQDIFWNFQQNILKKYKIKTISASTNEITSKYPKNHYKWKEIVFQRVFDKYFYNENNDNLINCITSIGDSLCEYNASHTASKYIKNRILNRIRLKSNPSINDMIIQLKQILNINKQFGLNINDINIDYCSLLSSSSSSISSLSMSCSDTTC